VLHTLALDEDGFVESDLYVANDDQRFFLFAESLVDDGANAAVLKQIGAAEAGVEDISDETALFGIDGFKAWAVVKALFGADVLGLPYLSLESYALDGAPVQLVRAGKTSEFGYLLLAPADAAARVWERIEKAGEPFGLRPVGMEAHAALRLDGRFFNLFAEGAKVRDPLPLGLQWMIDFQRENYRGAEAIRTRREAGLTKKIVGVAADAPDAPLDAGDAISHQGKAVAQVVCAAQSPTLGRRIGLALFDIAYAYAGLSFDGPSGRPICTISMPPFTARSLTVRLDEL
jgi:aminomethyltransferase